MPKTRQQSLSDLAESLERMLDATVESIDQIYREWQLRRDEHSDALDVLVVNVGHFVSDVEIRAKDDGYRDMQERTMQDLIRALRRGAPREELMRLNFLG